MKSIVFLRHGQAEYLFSSKGDFCRSLTEGGRGNARKIGREIMEDWGAPQLILTSTATRAFQTAQLVAKEVDYPDEKIEKTAQLYLASAEVILNELAKLPENIDNCLLVGHNPGLTDLINQMGVRLDNLPTTSAVWFSFNVESWTDILDNIPTFKGIKITR